MRRYITLESTLLVSLILLSNPIFCPAGQAVLKGGCAKVNITPPVGIPLIGSYGKPSDDILDELYAKALVLSDESTTLAIVSVDLLYAPLEEITNPVRKIIAEKTGIPEENVLICATHTHSGPEVFTRSKVPREGRVPASQIDQSYLATLIKKIASSALIAHKKMAAVRIGAAKGQIPEIVYNRRAKTKDGSVKMAFTLPPDERESVLRSTTKDELVFGPVDPEVLVLRVEDPNGQIVGSIVNFACHPVCIYPSLSTSISADYPACATQVVEQTEGGTCLFTLGTAGNIVPIKRGLKPCQQIGKALGAEALRKLQLVSTSGDVTLKAIRKEIKLPTKKAPSEDKTAKNSKTTDYVNTEIQVLKLGDIYILGLPGEILVELGLEIKKRAGLENLFVVSLSNDAIGYVCHDQAYEEGGYEPGSATNLAKGAGEIMIKEALDLISQIKPSPAPSP
ncbi:MAG: neutral/alkaline non-lysosomal ceramidase N-terminal domain-containing protein [Sedimentisphaerales bacterium]|nr:neutral/alkaline non-lysosomal ceramidase N-terminal domain-containing protein [Sedimentisphaerales bacterium]